MNKRSIRVYDIEGNVARVDTTTASSYGRVTEDGLLQFGHSKDKRPDLGQVKIASVTLDPLGMPLVTVPVSGEQADDNLYIPVIKQAQQSLEGRQGLLYVGDCKMGSKATRCELAYGQDYYLMPLSKVQVNNEKLEAYLEQFEALPEEERKLEEVTIIDEKEGEQLLAQGFTVTEEVECVRQQDGQDMNHSWTERRFVVLSPEYAHKQRRKLEKHVAEVEATVLKLAERRQGYKYPETKSDLEKQIAEILTKQGCQAYLQVSVSEEVICKRIRGYKGKPEREERSNLFHLQITRYEESLAQACRLLGWRVYATNAPEERLSLTKAVDVYRDAYLHEHGYSRLKGRPLSLTPMYLQKDEQITGLIRLLSLALRVLTLIEFVVRRQLAKEKSALAGLYPGNRKRKTKTPRTETLLGAFKGITLTIIHAEGDERMYLPSLSSTQKRILQLLGMTEEVYTCLVPEFAKVVLKSAN